MAMNEDFYRSMKTAAVGVMRRSATLYATCSALRPHECGHFDKLRFASFALVAATLNLIATKRALNPSTNPLHASPEALRAVARELSAVALTGLKEEEALENLLASAWPTPPASA